MDFIFRVGFIPTAIQKNPSRPTVFTKTENSGPREGEIQNRKNGANFVFENIPKFEQTGATLQKTGATAPYPSQIYGIS